MSDNEEITLPENKIPAPTELRVSDPEIFANHILDGFEKRMSERFKKVEAWMLERDMKQERRISILEATRLAPVVAAVGLAFAAFGIASALAMSAHAAPSCTEKH